MTLAALVPSQLTGMVAISCVSNVTTRPGFVVRLSDPNARKRWCEKMPKGTVSALPPPTQSTPILLPTKNNFIVHPNWGGHFYFFTILTTHHQRPYLYLKCLFCWLFSEFLHLQIPLFFLFLLFFLLLFFQRL